MSWSLHTPEIKAASVAFAKEKIAENNAPQAVKDYVLAGIDGLVTRYGPDVKVTVGGHGHLHNGEPQDYDVTSASIDVRKAE